MEKKKKQLVALAHSPPPPGQRSLRYSNVAAKRTSPVSLINPTSSGCLHSRARPVVVTW